MTSKYKYKFYLGNHYGGSKKISVISDKYKNALNELECILDSLGWPWNIFANVHMNGMDMDEVVNNE